MKNYYYVGPDRKSYGPVEANQLKNYGVTRDTLVWCEGMQDWTAAGKVIELSNLFANDTPVPPAPPVAPSVPPVNQQPANGVCPDNYLVWSILVTILCCWPFGIPAIVNATKVDKLWMQGDIQGAMEKSKAAKTWCWVSAGCALVFIVIYLILLSAGLFALDEISPDYYYY